MKKDIFDVIDTEVKKGGMTDFNKEKPNNKTTIDKNTYLINYIKDNCEDGVPEDFRAEMYDTLSEMTEAKLLAHSNMFNHMLAVETDELVEKLFTGVLAMHGVVIGMLTKFRDEMMEDLAPEHRGILNVLHFGRTGTDLPTAEEVSDEMDKFNDDPENANVLIRDALLPKMLNNVAKSITDIAQQSRMTGMYSVSNLEVLKTSISSGKMKSIYLPTKDGEGAFKVSLINKKAKKQHTLEEMIELSKTLTPIQYKKLCDESELTEFSATDSTEKN